MGRPAKSLDSDLADQLRQHMLAHGKSTAAIGAELGVHKATISRSLKQNSFSHEVRARVAAHLANLLDTEGPHEALRKALHLLSMSDKLRSDAERMIAKALDQMVERK